MKTVTETTTRVRVRMFEDPKDMNYRGGLSSVSLRPATIISMSSTESMVEFQYNDEIIYASIPNGAWWKNGMLQWTVDTGRTVMHYCVVFG